MNVKMKTCVVSVSKDIISFLIDLKVANSEKLDTEDFNNREIDFIFDNFC